MTLTITLDLTPDEEAQLRKGVIDHNKGLVRQLLLKAIEPTVDDLLSSPHIEVPIDQVTVQRREELIEQLHNIVTNALPADFHGLSDYAVSREGIYGEHP